MSKSLDSHRHVLGRGVLVTIGSRRLRLEHVAASWSRQAPLLEEDDSNAGVRHHRESSLDHRRQCLGAFDVSWKDLLLILTPFAVIA